MPYSKHLEAIKPNVEDGVIVMGGATLEEPVKEGQTPKANGSALICCADTKEEAMKIVESDVYTENNVWDLSKVCTLLWGDRHLGDNSRSCIENNYCSFTAYNCVQAAALSCTAATKVSTQ